MSNLFFKTRDSRFISRMIENKKGVILKTVRYVQTGDMTKYFFTYRGFVLTLHHHKNVKRYGFEGDLITVELDTMNVSLSSKDIESGLIIIDEFYEKIASITKGVYSRMADDFELFGDDEDDASFCFDLFKSEGGDMDHLADVIQKEIEKNRGKNE